MSYQPPADTPLNFIWVDDDLLVVDKPAGLLTVPGRGEEKADCLIARVQRDYPEALIVHRLDMGTSGLLILARGLEAQRRLGFAFEKRRIEKRYEARVAGLPLEDGGHIDLPLITDWPNRPRQMVDHTIGKPSRTRYQIIARDAETQTARVALFPETGRSHQLRVHLQAIGHPILGDELYAPPPWCDLTPRLCLHACALSFDHPMNGTRLSLDSPVPF